MTSPSCGFSCAVSGMMIPPAVFILSLDPADEDAVMKRPETHSLLSLAICALRNPAWHCPP